MKTIEKECIGKCPKCGSENIHWQDTDLHDEFISYKASCGDCARDFSEEYKLVYAVTIYREA